MDAVILSIEAAVAHFLAHPLLYLSLPVISAIVGWGTNKMALKMMFYPIEFIGIKPIFGWQGIIPRKAEQMASIAMETMLEKLVNVTEIFDRLDPDRVADEIGEPLLKMTDQVVDEVMDAHQPGLWENLPKMVKNRIYKHVRADAPQIVSDMMREIRDNIESVFDIRHMVISNLTRDKALLNKIFIETGEKEFKFIEKSGIYFGFLFGTIQMLVFMFYEGPWVLPIAGLLIGYLTNWIALKLIFKPRNPIKIGPVVFQGLFLKRQKEVARDYGSLIAAEILTPSNMIQEVLEGPMSDNLYSMIEKHVKDAVDKQAGITKPFVTMAVGTGKYREMKGAISTAFMKHMPAALEHIKEYTADAMDLKNTIGDRMENLTSEEFEGMLRPAFEQDEWMLIGIGAVLGFCVGTAQFVFMFAPAMLEAAKATM
jgi:uncharacterized membrane protein YheB (UPF0754 family)